MAGIIIVISLEKEILAGVSAEACLFVNFALIEMLTHLKTSVCKTFEKK